jgi:hypothetical protein
LGYFDYKTFWAADGADGDDLWVRQAINFTGYDLTTVRWDLGVDNGFKLYANGNFVAGVNEEGYTYRWEYTGVFSGLAPGLNVIALALEDHGGLTAFDMQITGTPAPVSEPATMLLLGFGLVGLSGLRSKLRRK